MLFIQTSFNLRHETAAKHHLGATHGTQADQLACRTKASQRRHSRLMEPILQGCPLTPFALSRRQ